MYESLAEFTRADVLQRPGEKSVLFDAVAIMPSDSGAALLMTLPAARDFIADATAHRKFIAHVEEKRPLLEKAIGADAVDEGFVLLKAGKVLHCSLPSAVSFVSGTESMLNVDVRLVSL